MPVYNDKSLTAKNDITRSSVKNVAIQNNKLVCEIPWISRFPLKFLL